MRNLKLVFVFTFVLTLASGVVAGVLVSRVPSAAHTTSRTRPLLLGEQLGLTADQNQQMKDIWEGTRDVVDECFQKAQAYQHERDDQLINLLTDEQKAAYATINDKYVANVKALNDKRTTAFKDAVENTKKLLTPEQRDKYEKILKSRLGQGAPGGPTPAWLGPGACLPADLAQQWR